MKANICKWMVLGCALLLLPPLAAFGQDNYLAFKAGFYTPNGDLTDDGADFDSGFSGEIAWGHYVTPNFVLEPVVGYFETDDSFSDPLASFSFDISVIPITITAKGIMPLQFGEVYLGAGIGLYYTQIDADVTFMGMSASDDDSDTVFGGQIVAGANFDLASNWFLGFEGKYLLTEEAEAFDDSLGADLNGYILSAVLGYRL
ncbi:MAG TPA: outer membrane beta-barrel protein [Desulfobacterales bacterium]